MKKWLLLLVGFIFLIVICIYAFIPGSIAVQQQTVIAVNARAFTRTILDEQAWRNWWPGEVLPHPVYESPTQFRINQTTVRLLGKYVSAQELAISIGNDSLLTQLIFIPKGTDSVQISWEGKSGTTLNLLERLRRFSAAKKLKSDLDLVLQRLTQFYRDEKNIYGIMVLKEQVEDSTLISTVQKTNGLPPVELVYQLVEKLKNFAQKKGALPTGRPMLNIATNDSLEYRTQVALPINKKLKDEGDIAYRWMLSGGNILRARVTGGPYTIAQTLGSLEQYISDHRRVAPAIPFQSLVTDRRAEPDTAKWITDVYWPVM